MNKGINVIAILVFLFASSCSAHTKNPCSQIAIVQNELEFYDQEFLYGIFRNLKVMYEEIESRSDLKEVSTLSLGEGKSILNVEGFGMQSYFYLSENKIIPLCSVITEESVLMDLVGTNEFEGYENLEEFVVYDPEGGFAASINVKNGSFFAVFKTTYLD